MFTKSINLLLYLLFREFKTVFFSIEMSNRQIDRNNNVKKKNTEIQKEKSIQTKTFLGSVFCISCLLIHFFMILELEIQTSFVSPGIEENKLLESYTQNIRSVLASFSNIQFCFIMKAINLLLCCHSLSNSQKICLKKLKSSISEANLNMESTKPAKKFLKIFYVYRLTGSTEIAKLEKLDEKLYYYGYRGTSFVPYEDLVYNSSSECIKNLTKKYGNHHFSKRILGIYVSQEHAIQKEIYLHHYFDVKKHPKFYNLANQTSKKFEYDNTGRVQKLEVNKKRSEALKGRPKHSVESRQKISQSHLARERSEEETANRKKHVENLNQEYVICPHCQKKVQKVAGKRWHFDNCLKNSNALEETFIVREKLRQNMIIRNKLKKDS